jgi:hypothetical protein
LGELIAAAMGSGAHAVLNLGAMRILRRLLIVVNCKTPSFTMLFIFIWSQIIATSLAPTRWQSATRTTVLDRPDGRAMVVPSFENKKRKSKLQKNILNQTLINPPRDAPGAFNCTATKSVPRSLQ